MIPGLIIAAALALAAAGVLFWPSAESSLPARLDPNDERYDWEYAYVYTPFVETANAIYKVGSRPSSSSYWVTEHVNYNNARDIVVGRVLRPAVGAEDWVDLGGQMVRKADVIRWGVQEDFALKPPGWAQLQDVEDDEPAQETFEPQTSMDVPLEDGQEVRF